MFSFHSFTCSCPVFLAPLIEEAIFASLYILASFVKNKVPLGAWVYFWAFYLVPLVYISVLEKYGMLHKVVCMSSLHRGHANLLCIVPLLVYVVLK